jgi:PAS domain S-box-containing protein
VEGGQFGYTVSTLIMVYLPAIIHFSLIHNTSTTSAISLKFENRLLLDQVQKANEVLLQDITERRRSEQALREREESFRRLFEDSADPIILMDDQHVLDCNSATTRLFGYSKEEMLSSSLWEFSPKVQPDGSPAIEKATEMTSLAKTNGHHHFEWLHRKANGSHFTVEVMLTQILLHGREVLHASLHDITERKRNEKALKASYDMLEEVNADLALSLLSEPFMMSHVKNFERVLMALTPISPLEFPALRV